MKQTSHQYVVCMYICMYYYYYDEATLLNQRKNYYPIYSRSLIHPSCIVKYGGNTPYCLVCGIICVVQVGCSKVHVWVVPFVWCI
jgi:hypothetical protein